jgi:hypothetical protein
MLAKVEENACANSHSCLFLQVERPKWSNVLRYITQMSGRILYKIEPIHQLDRRLIGYSTDGESARRYTPERPPVFSHRVSPSITIPRSADLHMS